MGADPVSRNAQETGQLPERAGLPGSDQPVASPVPRVVLADDHKIFREGIRMLMENAGMEIVADAGEAHEILSAVRRTRPDILLLDIDLEKSCGLDLLAPIRAASPGTKIIVFTADRSDHILRKFLAAGIDGYQLKSTSVHNLIKAMRHVMAGHRVLPRGVKAPLNSEFHPEFPDKPKLLTAREIEVLSQLRKGASNNEIAETMHISPHTVKVHVLHVMRKLSVKKRIDFLKPREKM